MADLSIQVIVFLLLFARVGAVTMALPVFTEDGVPMQVRLLIAIGLTLGLYGMLRDRVAAPDGNGALIAALVIELVIGLGIGLLVRILFSAAAMAGSLVSLQIGLSSVLVPDAALGGQAPLLSRFVTVAVLVACMAMGVHHLWIAAIVHSYDQFPVGTLPPAADLLRVAVGTTGRAMALAVNLAAPLLVYAILFNTALGLSARLAPAIQVFFVVQPLNLVFGIALFATLAGAMMTAFAGSMASWIQTVWG